jgi:hypothetical protein
MIPIPMTPGDNIPCTYTFSVPNLLWYDFSAATASVETNGKNVVVGATFSKLWDFSGTTTYSTYGGSASYIGNYRNGLSTGLGFLDNPFYGVETTLTSTTFTMIMIGFSVTPFRPISAEISNALINRRFGLFRGTSNRGIQINSPAGSGIDQFINLTYTDNSNVLIGGCTVSNTQSSIFTPYGDSNSGTVVGFTSSNTQTSITSNENPFGVGGGFAEFMMWDRILTQVEIDNAFNYLKCKWDV